MKDTVETTRPDHEGDEAYRCGGCGSRRLMLSKADEILHGVCMDCLRLQEVETRDWPMTAMCDNCAFRVGSPERADPYRWDEVKETLTTGQHFHCHKGLSMTMRPDGVATFDPPDRQTGSVHVCAGWFAAYVATFKRDRHPATTIGE